MEFIGIIIALLAAAALYLLVPIIYCLTDAELSPSKIKKVTLINAICIYLAFVVICSASGVDSPTVLFTLWSGVGYIIMTKKYEKDEKTKEKLMILQEKVDFYDNHIAIIIKGYGNYYYTYEDMIKVTRDAEEYEIEAFNTEEAIDRGYKSYRHTYNQQRW